MMIVIYDCHIFDVQATGLSTFLVIDKVFISSSNLFLYAECHYAEYCYAECCGTLSSGLYYRNMMNVNDDHHECCLYYKYSLGAWLMLIDNFKSVSDDSRVMFQLVPSFTIVIYNFHIFIVQATGLSCQTRIFQVLRGKIFVRKKCWKGVHQNTV